MTDCTGASPCTRIEPPTMNMAAVVSGGLPGRHLGHDRDVVRQGRDVIWQGKQTGAGHTGILRIKSARRPCGHGPAGFCAFRPSVGILRSGSVSTVTLWASEFRLEVTRFI